MHVPEDAFRTGGNRDFTCCVLIFLCCGEDCGVGCGLHKVGCGGCMNLEIQSSMWKEGRKSGMPKNNNKKGTKARLTFVPR